ncbi:fumarate reductase/succinate dehydrogenase flavoprotein domain protein [Leadbetterella byssophila DSM 17132]|uniref:Fumarate reductase/succinate dehydrogenase flavoprotein domain protein n=1 Tax=Leadbetterella byssophila (strain DSM 17132 / JCM 16389 / KACC 11308 / NBRC 106382 / 4M15) TaxID=649349 RepID=E4RVF3_LEAB4|nr:FAD-dependent oxidoreductase [Leadbetterella byssophila]ADQ16139.1 fumarate reductase/succinate dehydrogenase flavoprotein domain protein [Leadbetterella byssophila DSM 17132]
MKTIQEPAREIKVRKEVDVLVVGGGPSGITAALAAAEDGLKVLLVESRSFVGGNMTIGLPILGFLGQKGNQIIKGIPQKFIDRLKAVDAASEHRPCPLHMSLTLVEPEAVKTVALEMLMEAGVEVMFYSFFSEAIVEGDELKGIIIESKSGREAILAKTVIDCSGDADVAYRAGVPTEYGNAEGGVQPPTLMFCLGGVDTEKLRLSIAEEPRTYLTDFIPAEYFGQNNQFIVVGLRSLIQKAAEDGLKLPVERTIIITGLRKGEAWINMTRINGVNGTDPESLTYGETEGRKQMADIQKYLIEYVPGFENAYFVKTAPFVGIRETRRIGGKYTMTQEDVLSCKHFEDAIAVASYPLDIHHPQGGGCTLVWCGDCYDIPFRSLVPQNIKNLLVAGRSISCTHEAMSAIRVMAPCMAMGEAAGRAAKQAVRKGISVDQISVKELQDELLEKGAYLREYVEA